MLIHTVACVFGLRGSESLPIVVVAVSDKVSRVIIPCISGTVILFMYVFFPHYPASTTYRDASPGPPMKV